MVSEVCAHLKWKVQVTWIFEDICWGQGKPWSYFFPVVKGITGITSSEVDLSTADALFLSRQSPQTLTLSSVQATGQASRMSFGGLSIYGWGGCWEVPHNSSFAWKICHQMIDSTWLVQILPLLLKYNQMTEVHRLNFLCIHFIPQI